MSCISPDIHVCPQMSLDARSISTIFIHLTISGELAIKCDARQQGRFQPVEILEGDRRLSGLRQPHMPALGVEGRLARAPGQRRAKIKRLCLHSRVGCLVEGEKNRSCHNRRAFAVQMENALDNTVDHGGSAAAFGHPICFPALEGKNPSGFHHRWIRINNIG